MGGPTTVTWRGARFDPRTRDMLVELTSRVSGYVQPSQGSYSTSDPDSGGTHAGGGAVDIRCSNLTDAQEFGVVLWGRRIGFAMWLRRESKSWPRHIHGIAIGCPDLSLQARQQVTAYRNGRNGLAGASEGPDGGPDVPFTTWEQYRQQLEDDMPTAAELWRYRNDAIEKGDVFGLLVEAYRRAGDAETAAKYANDQLESIAGGVAVIAKSLADGTVDSAELRSVYDRLSGKA